MMVSATREQILLIIWYRVDATAKGMSKEDVAILAKMASGISPRVIPKGAKVRNGNR